MVSTALVLMFMVLSGLSLAATHTLASVALVFKEVRVIRVVRIHKAIAGRITLDELFRISSNLSVRGRASSAHNAIEHFAVLIAKNHRKAAVSARTTALRAHTSASTTTLAFSASAT